MARRRGSHAHRNAARPLGRALAGVFTLAVAAGAWALTGADRGAGPGSASAVAAQAAAPAPAPEPSTAPAPAPSTATSTAPSAPPAPRPDSERASAPERAARVAAPRAGKAPPAQVRPSAGRLAAPDREALAADKAVQRTNEARESAGCAPLQVDPRLVAAARAHSADMARRGYFDHISPEGIGFDERQEAQGYPDPGAENIAVGHATAATVVAHWLRSPSHRATILDRDFKRIGIGLSTDGRYWTQEFGY